ncbi:MAG TPA: hypothetical protein QGG47_10895 [Acidobacteriota bacterium]|nr:hypothetical protein [Acidobacteriota bacterium]
MSRATITPRIGRLAMGAGVALLLAAGSSWAVPHSRSASAAAPVPTVPAPEGTAPKGQEAQRLRQLAVFEGLLTDLVQERVSGRVNTTIDLERNGDSDADGQTNRLNLEPVVVKVGRPLAAHGFYLDGYGVMFSIQTPQVAVLPRSFDARMAAPMAALRANIDPGFEEHPLDPGLIDMRADLLMRSVGDLRVLMERDAEAVDAEAVHELSKFEAVLEEIRRSVAPGTEGTEDAATDRETTATEQARRQYEGAWVRPRLRDSHAYFRGAIEQQRTLKQILERDHQQIADAVNDAAIEALAQFGTVLRGLDSDDQVSIMVLPPNPWMLARRNGVGVDQAEYVISIRYKDIRDYGNEKIDMDKFRERVEIHDRLGTELEIGAEQQ